LSYTNGARRTNYIFQLQISYSVRNVPTIMKVGSQYTKLLKELADFLAHPVQSTSVFKSSN